MTKLLIGITALLTVVSFISWRAHAGQTSQTSAATQPVLVELFTSEGCSSCPPADSYLRQLDTQSIQGTEVVVLSEHVDYWDHLGWRDVYSNHAFTERQNNYAQRFGLQSAYTPQMVVDGSVEFVGSDERAAQQAITKSSQFPKVEVQIESATIAADGAVHAQIKIEPNSIQRNSGGDVYVALALNRAVSHVKHGENEGRELAHVAVVADLQRVGSLKRNEAFTKEVHFKTKTSASHDGFRLVAFVQSPNSGPVLGATMKKLQ
jgi:hypothetical protein